MEKVKEKLAATKGDAQPLYDVVLMDFGKNSHKTNPIKPSLYPLFKLIPILTMTALQINFNTPSQHM